MFLDSAEQKMFLCTISLRAYLFTLFWFINHRQFLFLSSVPVSFRIVNNMGFHEEWKKPAKYSYLKYSIDMNERE